MCAMTTSRRRRCVGAPRHVQRPLWFETSVRVMLAAAADSYGGTAAADTVNQLRSDRYNAELNLDGTRDVPLSECTVTGTHGIPKTAPSAAHRWPRGSSSPWPSTSTARQTTDR